MTPEQKKQYLVSPNHCPFCNSDNISAYYFEADGSYQKIECYTCGKKWNDIYTLTDVEEIEL